MATELIDDTLIEEAFMAEMEESGEENRVPGNMRERVEALVREMKLDPVEEDK